MATPQKYQRVFHWMWLISLLLMLVSFVGVILFIRYVDAGFGGLIVLGLWMGFAGMLGVIMAIGIIGEIVNKRKGRDL